MLKPFRKITRFSGSSKESKIVLVAWLIAVVVLSVLAPSAKKHDISGREGSVGEDTASEIAQEAMDQAIYHVSEPIFFSSGRTNRCKTTSRTG